ncbi:MAG: hypothetical protein AAB692_04485 [Patescibacteria group bacterium]
MRPKLIALAAAAGILSGAALSWFVPRIAIVHSRPAPRRMPELIVVPIDGIVMNAPRPIVDPAAVSASLVLDDRILGDVSVWIEGDDLRICWSNGPRTVMTSGHVCVQSAPFKDDRWMAPGECPFRLEDVSSIEDVHELAIPLVVCCFNPGPIYVRAHAVLLNEMREKVALHVTIKYQR